MTNLGKIEFEFVCSMLFYDRKDAEKPQEVLSPNVGTKLLVPWYWNSNEPIGKSETTKLGMDRS